MSSKSPRLEAKEVIKQLKNHGFTEVTQTGSHLKLYNPHWYTKIYRKTGGYKV